MSAKIIEFRIRGHDGSVTIGVIGRCYDTDDYWDGNWVDTLVEVRLLGYHASFRDCTLRTDEVEAFLNELQLMYTTLAGKAELQSMEGAIYLRAEVNRMGSVHWEGHTIYPVGNGNTLTFSLDSDQSYLPELIKELKNVLLEFPVKGRKTPRG